MLIAASHGHKYALFAFSAELKDPQFGPRRLIIVKRLGEGVAEGGGERCHCGFDNGNMQTLSLSS